MDIHCKVQACKRRHMAVLRFSLYTVKLNLITSVRNLESQQLKRGQCSQAKIDAVLQVLNDKLNRYKINKQLYFLLRTRQQGCEWRVLSNEGQEELCNAAGCYGVVIQEGGVLWGAGSHLPIAADIIQITTNNHLAGP